MPVPASWCERTFLVISSCSSITWNFVKIWIHCGPGFLSWHSMITPIVMWNLSLVQLVELKELTLGLPRMWFAVWWRTITSFLPQWFSQDLTSLYQPHLSSRWFLLEFETIWSSLSSILFILYLYIRYLVIDIFSMGERFTYKKRIW